MSALEYKRKNKKLFYFQEMIIDKEERKKMYDHFDSKYKETETDKEILDSMTKRRNG